MFAHHTELKAHTISNYIELFVTTKLAAPYIHSSHLSCQTATKIKYILTDICFVWMKIDFISFSGFYSMNRTHRQSSAASSNSMNAFLSDDQCQSVNTNIWSFNRHQTQTNNHFTEFRNPYGPIPNDITELHRR